MVLNAKLKNRQALDQLRRDFKFVTFVFNCFKPLTPNPEILDHHHHQPIDDELRFFDLDYLNLRYSS
jgi:hypothetical protein